VSWVLSRVGDESMIEALLRAERFESSWSKAFWIVSSVTLTGHRGSDSGLVGRRGGALRGVDVGGLEGGSSGSRRSGDRGRQIL
jgi:hypothetical protein